MRTRDVHDAIGNQRRHLQAEVLHVLDVVASIRKKLLPERHRIDPLHRQLFYILGIDLIETAVTVRAQLSVVGQPISRFRMHDASEIDFIVPRRASNIRDSRFHACQPAKVSDQVLQFFRTCFDGGHRRPLFVLNRGNLAFLQEVELSLEVLQPDIKIAAAAHETTHGLPIP